MSNWIILYITLPCWEFLLKWYISFENFVEAEISCCAPRFPLILTAKLHFLYLKESESEILESRIRKFYLRLRNPAATQSEVFRLSLKHFFRTLSHPRHVLFFNYDGQWHIPEPEKY